MCWTATHPSPSPFSRQNVRTAPTEPSRVTVRPPPSRARRRWPPMSRETDVGPGLHADPDVVLGYLPSRPVDRRLVLGRDAHLRSGTILYLGSSIGERFETGHHVVVREECQIGDDVSVWTGSVIDY